MKNSSKLTPMAVALLILLMLPAIGNGRQVNQEGAEATDTPPPVHMSTFTFTGQDGSPMVISAPVFPAPMATSSSWGGFGSDGYGYLNDPSVRKDLEFVDEQYDKFKELQTDFQKEMQALMQDQGQANPGNEWEPTAAKDFQKKMEIINNAHKEAIRDLLLPHQLERYQQVARQMKMQFAGPVDAYQGFLAKELGITEEQKKTLRKIQSDYHKQLAETSKKLKESAEEKVMSTLTSDQKSKLKELMGDNFKQDLNDWSSPEGL